MKTLLTLSLFFVVSFSTAQNIDEDSLSQKLETGTYFVELPSEISKQGALRDIENGIVLMLIYGYLNVNECFWYAAEKLGFKYCPVAGCVVGRELVASVKEYNSVVEAYLIDQHGTRWKSLLEEEEAKCKGEQSSVTSESK